ncbi:unnamed protein product [Musa textilis]
MGAPIPRPMMVASTSGNGGNGFRYGFKEGQSVGLWRCILAFDSTVAFSASSSPIPPLLCLSSLASKGIQVCEGKESHDTAEYADTGYKDGSSDSCSTTRYVKLRNQKNHRTLQASKYLRVGLTVLKRKCREFGIPRWPHRKIKSLDNLIQNLQEEVHRQEEENKSAAMKAVIKRQRMLEGEKECIEKNPFMELQTETKRFRQDVFKRRHRAKALLSKQDFGTSPMKACT